MNKIHNYQYIRLSTKYRIIWSGGTIMDQNAQVYQNTNNRPKILLRENVKTEYPIGHS